MKRALLWLSGTCVVLSVAVASAQDEKPRRPQAAVKQFDPARLLEQFDKNKDGVLEPSECPPQLRQRFDQMDANHDGKLNKQEMQAGAKHLREATPGRSVARSMPGTPDRPAAGSMQKRPDRPATGSKDARAAVAGTLADDPLFRLLDTNHDGTLSSDELERAVKLLQDHDDDDDGMLSRDELPAPTTKGGRRGEVITKAAKGERYQDTLAVGDVAPDFTLPDLSGKNEITLSSFRGQRPVVLVFASYT